MASAAPREHLEGRGAARGRSGPRTGPRVWVYGFVDAGTAPEGLGVTGARVEAIRHGVLAALVSHVRLERLSGHDGERLWREHEEVLARAMRAATVVPCRPWTVVARDATVRRQMQRQEPALREALERLRGVVEWDVRVVRRDGSDGAVDAAVQTATTLHERLSKHAGSAVTGWRDGEPRAAGDGTVLDAAYLVTRARAPLFRVLVEELAAQAEPRGVEVQVAGPGPARHFVAERA
jgi:hypothetical protein